MEGAIPKVSQPPAAQLRTLNASKTPAVLATRTVLPTSPTPQDTLTDAEAETLGSLEKVDDYPLYIMHYTATYQLESFQGENSSSTNSSELFTNPWGCSLFAAFGGSEAGLYGRNFDWDYSPALLLFKESPGAYASVSMVDLAYFGYEGEKATNLLELSLEERRPLLDAPRLPFDGMNEHGLVVGMAAVQKQPMPYDPGKPSIGSIGIMREALDHARNVDEALALFERYNIQISGGPPLHYLLADRSGKAALVEFLGGEMRITPNEQPWHAATNFINAAVEGDRAGTCWRYDAITERMDEKGGKLSIAEALALLEQVSQDSTQWSVVYDLANMQVHVVVGQQYGSPPHVFKLGE